MTRAALILLLVAAGAAPLARSEPVGPARRGATRDEVQKSHGPPQRVSRLVLFRRHVEQWHYTNPPRTVEFNCVRGEQPYVLRELTER